MKGDTLTEDGAQFYLSVLEDLERIKKFASVDTDPQSCRTKEAIEKHAMRLRQWAVSEVLNCLEQGWPS